ncbi:MAG: hypothetical protein LUG50_03385 [Planctomycetaceae bacterium]|nr:hypothetical protein [Planctomycetaceae bacterium]
MADNSPAAKKTGVLLPRANASVRSRAMGTIPMTVQALSSRLRDERRRALDEAVQSFEDGSITRPQETGWVNVLARTFFSFSQEGYSPTRLVWEAVVRGLSVIGSADRDNLGALGEMHTAGDCLRIRTTVSMTTTVYDKAHPDAIYNLPGRPGHVRVMAAGIPRVPKLDCHAGQAITTIPEHARRRNLRMVEKLNTLLAPVKVDFDADVVPLTAGGNATPAHIARAYGAKAITVFPELADLSVFWADVLGKGPPETEQLLGDLESFHAALEEQLQNLAPDTPGPGDYPVIDDFFAAVREAGAVPCLVWRGDREGLEAEPEILLDQALAWGVRALAVYPDTYWNVQDQDCKATRLSHLRVLMEGAADRNLKVLAGSAMDGPKQKFVDAFDAPELAAYFREFADSAFWLYGHATLERALGLGRESEWAEHAFGRDAAAANAVYTEVGEKAAPGKTTRARIAGVGTDANPGEILDALKPLRI